MDFLNILILLAPIFSLSRWVGSQDTSAAMTLNLQKV